jgi:glucokinase
MKNASRRRTTLVEDLNLKAAHLMNDLEAVARALPALRAEDMITINKGEPVANGPIAIIAPGTGLGESFLTWDGSQYSAPTAPKADTQILLPRTSVKSVCCIIFFHVSGTWDWSVSALESVFPIFTNFFAMRKLFPNGRKLLS